MKKILIVILLTAFLFLSALYLIGYGEKVFAMSKNDLVGEYKLKYKNVDYKLELKKIIR